MMGYWYAQAVAFVKKYAKLTACLWLLTGCDPQTVPAEKSQSPSPPRLKRAIYSAYLQLDPHFAKVSADAAPLRDLLVGLWAFDPKGQAVPVLAKQQFSDDQQNWLFILDEQATWSNGEPVTAQDFVASWQRLADPAQKSPLAPYLIYMGVQNAKEISQGDLPPSALGVQALNPHTLQIRLRKANTQLPQMLAHSALLPTYRGLKPAENGDFISNGDYHLLEHRPQTLILQANRQDLPFQQVAYQLITSKQNPQQFDIVENLLPHYQGEARTLPRLCTYFYEFNFADPMFSNKTVRQAVRAMISSAEVSRGVGLPNHSVLPRTMQTVQDRQLSTVSAEHLFSQLGLTPQQPLKFTLTYDAQGNHEAIAQRIAGILGRSDLLRVQLQAVDWRDLLAKRNAKAFQFIRSGWCADYADPMLFLTAFHSQSPDNKSGYANETVDRYLSELAEKPLSVAQRQQYIEAIVAQLDNDIAILPLFQYQRKMWIANDIQGVLPENASEVIYSKDLYRTKGK
ncbi:hypothetical protein RO21_08690 [[Actinobacillus] muris]|uniref:Solute-binding protein family 5 domain-containing protein n=1 Tax=Muribacter muris TaxID=67855 RepID=A0A0J5P3B3_9PAST|nr:peptide ABC transporter substrate-binding protein [Muribacter muris]KMK50968.1 hypothetical protein RO21_08690 [[Actinobacillus] muris] [Muribacter muris]